MTLTRIQLTGNNKGYLDVDENTAFPLTFAISEIRDLSKRKGTFSKSVTLKGTHNNHKLLNFYFDFNIEAYTFDINKIAYCNIIQDGVIILENMLIQLVSVGKVQNDSTQDEQVKYTVLIKDSVSDLFTVINNKLLENLSGFSYMNHTYTADNVVASWDNTIDSGFVDPSDGLLKTGFKYVMPIGDNGRYDTEFLLEEFKPAIYAKKYLDSIFAEAGYSYSWPTMDNNDIRFSKLLIPFTGEVPTPTDKDTEEFYVKAMGTGLTVSTQSSIYNDQDASTVILRGELSPIPATIEIEDPMNLYNPTTSVFTTPDIPSNNNFVKYTFDINWSLVMDNQESGGLGPKPVFLGASTNYVTFPDAASAYTATIAPKVKIYKDGAPNDTLGEVSIGPFGDYVYGYDENNDAFEFAPGITVLHSGTTSNVVTTLEGLAPFSNIKLRGGFDVINDEGGYNWSLFIFENDTWKGGSSGVAEDAKFKMVINSITNLRIQTTSGEQYGFNATIPMDRFIPREVKQSDFVNSIITMFNLYAEIDKDNPKQINFITRDEYYDSGELVDWTMKLAKDQEQNIEFLPELQNKRYLLTYKKEDDIPNTTYYDNYNKIYGQQEFIFDNEFVKDKQTREIMFGPTPMMNTSFGAVLPMIPGINPDILPRILYDGGRYTCNQYRLYDYYISAEEIKYISPTSYPHITHWDRPENPTYDLNFGGCESYYRTDNYGNVTNNNLFNLHWRRTLNQINTGKLLTGYFNLTPLDIQRLKLNHKVKIGNTYWNINAIKDYNANAKNLTKVELISIDEGTQIPFIPAIITEPLVLTDPRLSAVRDLIRKVNVVKNRVATNTPVDIQGQMNFVNNNIKNATIIGDGNTLFDDALIFGDVNTVYGTSTILGDNNTVYGDHNFIFGNLNTVSSGVTHSILFGSNIVAESGNTLYANNIFITSGGTLNGYSIDAIVSAATAPDIYLTGGTFSSNTLTLRQNGGGPNVTVTGFTSGGGGSSVTITGGTYTNGDTGTLSLSNSTGGTINIVGFKDSQLEKITENSKTGYRILGAPAANYGDIGTNAVDLSVSNSASSTRGALGDYSFAIGLNATASGTSSVSFGSTVRANSSIGLGGSTVDGDFSVGLNNGIVYSNATYAFAGGQGGQASGTSAFAFGASSTIAGNDYAFAAGITAQAMGMYSFSLGNNTRSFGTNSFSIGVTTIASGNTSFAGGSGTNSNANLAFSYGSTIRNFGAGAVVFGTQSGARGQNSFTNGINLSANTYTETVLGAFAVDVSGSATTLVATEPALRVGIGTSTGNRRDAFRIYKNGTAYLNPVPLSAITNGAQGFIAFNTSGNTIAVHNGTSWSNLVKASNEKFGDLTIVPDNITDTFTFAHGMAGTPTVISSRKSDPLINEFETSADATNIIINFPIGAPVSGANIVVSYIAKL